MVCMSDSSNDLPQRYPVKDTLSLAKLTTSITTYLLRDMFTLAMLQCYMFSNKTHFWNITVVSCR